MKKIFFTINIVLALFAIVFNIFFGFEDFLILFLYLAITSVVLSAIFRLIFKKLSLKKFFDVWILVFLRVWAFLGLILLFLGSFIFYQNRIDPGVSANIVLQNSSGQTIAFVGMSHIALPSFYEQKNNSLKNFFKDDFVFLLEGVGTGSTESHDIFNKNLGFNFDENLYSNLAKIIDLKEQNRELYDGIDKEKLIFVDMTMDEIANLLQNSDNSQSIENINFDKAIDSIEKFSNFQKFILKQSVYSVLNFSLKNTKVDIFLENLPESHKNLFNIIVNSRNQKVIDYIIAHPEEKIAIVYGALHFDGIFQGLKKSDNSWKIISVEKFFPYSQY